MDLSTRQGRREQGQRIQQAVERAGISIEELAGRLGCSRALIYQYLSGSVLAQPDRLQQIAAQCGVPLTYFYSDSSDPASSEPLPAPGMTASVVTSGEGTTPTVTPAPSVGVPQSAPQDVTARLSDGLRALQELAKAQESPSDYRALASTCERILSLAAQLGDRPAQARAQLDLGNALNNIGDFPRAAEALGRAVTLAVEIGNTSWETSARQSLGRAYLMMGRTEEARSEFQRVADSPDFHSRWRGLLSLGSIHERQGEYQQAMQRFEEAAFLLEEAEINRLADPHEIGIGLLYVNTNRRNVYLAGGDLNEARRLAQKCLSDAEALGNADQNLESRLDLGWCDVYTGRWPQAQQGLNAMLQLARFVGDQRRETMGRAALGIFQAAVGDFDTAIANGKDALAQALSRGDRLAELYAQLALADAYTGANGRGLEARYHTNQALSVTTSVRYARSEIECRLRLARVSAQAGDLAGLREASERALALSQSLGARHLESLARAWYAESLRRSAQQERAGDRENETLPAAKPADVAQVPARAIVVDLLAQARQEAQTALELAETTDFVETRWRAWDTLGRLSDWEEDAAQSEISFRAAVSVLERLRESLVAAGILDTLLENEDCLSVYERLAMRLLKSGRVTEAAGFLEQTGWPPLTARLELEVTRLQDTSEE